MPQVDCIHMNTSSELNPRSGNSSFMSHDLCWQVSFAACSTALRSCNNIAAVCKQIISVCFPAPHFFPSMSYFLMKMHQHTQHAIPACAAVAMTKRLCLTTPHLAWTILLNSRSKQQSIDAPSEVPTRSRNSFFKETCVPRSTSFFRNHFRNTLL